MDERRSPYLKHLYVCVNQRDPGVTCCAHGDSEAIRQKLKSFVNDHGLKGKVRVSSSGCQDLCAQGPNVMVEPDHQWYHHVTLESVDEIIEEHLVPLVSSPKAASGMRPQAFLFDLGNVLVRFDHRIAARAITSHSGLDPQKLYELLFDSSLVVDHDEGRLSTPAFYRGLQEKIGLSMPYEEFLNVWNDIFSEIPATTFLVRGLLAQAPCFLISNTNRPHFESCLAHYPILREMEGWILSYEVGFLKPHPAIYRRALEIIRLPASEILYIDDRSDLIEAGRQFGFQVHRFTDPPALRADLETRGIHVVS